MEEQTIWIQEDYIEQRDDGHSYRIGECPAYDTGREWSERGHLFRDLRREYGACVSKVYIDSKDGTKPIGWVFSKRRQYEDNRSKSYIHEVWVTLLKSKPVKSVSYEYLEVK